MKYEDKIKAASKESLKKLLKYPKKEIGEALERQNQSADIINDMLNYLEEKAKQKMLDSYDKALDADIKAKDMYLKWMCNMCVKYGDGKAVKLSVLPPEEITYGAKLEKAVQEASKTKQKFANKIDRIFITGE